MLPGDSSQQISSAPNATPKVPLITHIRKAREFTLYPSYAAAAAQALTGKSRFCRRLSPSKHNQNLRNPPHNTSSSSSSSAAILTIANNEDLLTNILLYLPPKSLLRFQSVCKNWLSIISSPAFRRLHSQVYHSTTKALFLFRREGFKTPADLNFVSFSDEYVNPMGNIVSHLSNLNNFFSNGEIVDLHSCNGLLALVFKLDDYGVLVVYNPTTRQHRIIPPAEMVRPRHFVALSIVFDPLKSSDHYKLVYVWWETYIISEEEGLSINRYGFSVYASETRIWRDSKDTIVGDPFVWVRFDKGVVWNGDIHWISNWKSFFFDLDKECLNSTDLCLRYGNGAYDYLYFGESGGCLYVVELRPGEGFFDIFEMKRDYSKWVFKHQVDLAPLATLYPSTVRRHYRLLESTEYRYSIPCFLEDEKEKKLKLVIYLPGKIILFDIYDMTVKELAEVGPEGADGGWWEHYHQWTDGYQHMETLAYV